MAKPPKVLGLPSGIDAPTKRQLSVGLQERSQKETFAKALDEKVAYGSYLAVMVWDLIVHGQAVFADGRVIEITDYDEWLATVRFMLTHLDGPAKDSVQLNQLNLFKVYAGFDPDQV